MRVARVSRAMGAWRLLLLAALPALVGVGAGEVLEVRATPVFLPTRRGVTAAPGGRAALACRIAHLGDKAVSWVRARDLQILAHAGQVFSADARVGVAVTPPGPRSGSPGSPGSPGSRDVVTHTLRLERLRASDAGRYECQINTEPKLSQIYNLTITDGPLPRVAVAPLGARAVRGAAGGAATLACAARLQPEPPAAPAAPGAPDAPALALAWYKDGTPLLPQRSRAAGGVSLDTERAAGRVWSRLTLAALAPADAGRYTCRVSARGAGPRPGQDEGEVGGEEELGEGEEEEEERLRGETTLTLLVLEDADMGEMEAMQRDAGAPAAAPRAAPGPALLAAAALHMLAAALL